MQTTRRISAVLLSALMLFGLAACGTSMPGYMAEMQKVNDWQQYETTLSLEVSAKADAEAALDFTSAQGEMKMSMLVDRENLLSRLSGSFEGDIKGLNLQGMTTDIHGVYDEQAAYLQDGLIYVPVKLVRDICASEYYPVYSLDALEQDYIALSPEMDEEDLAELELLQSAVYTAEQYAALGEQLKEYTTGLRFQKSGRSYTLSGKVEQLPAEFFNFYLFVGQNIEALNDILQLGLSEEELASLQSEISTIDVSQSDLEELEAYLTEQGVSGDFSAKVTFADQKATQQVSFKIAVKGYGELEVKAESTTSKRSSLKIDVPEATEPMTVREFENFLYDWNEEAYPPSAIIYLEEGYMTTTYWTGSPAHDYLPCALHQQEDGEYLIGFRNLMEGMGLGVDYDAATDTIYYVDKTGEKTPVGLFEENGTSFISLEQLYDLGFSAYVEDDWVIFVEYIPGGFEILVN